MRSRLFTLFLTVYTLALAWPAPASAQDTTAVAVNTKDGSTEFRLAFHVGRTMQSVVDEANAAVAVGSCSECRTVAIAFQVVLAMGDVDELTPTNLALALNVDCTSCDTAAFAYQFVTGTGGPVHFTAQGNRRLAELRRRLRGLRDAGLSDDQLAAELDAVADELRDVLVRELVPAGPPGSARGGHESPLTQPEGETPTATPTSAPATADTPAETPTPTATSTPAPASSATPTPTPTEPAAPAETATPAPAG